MNENKNKKSGSAKMTASVNAVFARYARLRLDTLCDMSDPFAAYRIIRICCITKKSAYDMAALYDTLRMLCAVGKSDRVHAVAAVYFARHGAITRKNEISLRARRYASDMFFDERTVYRYLDEARRLYCKLRKNMRFHI